MSSRLFGTDGIRGTANNYPMTADVALALGKAAGRYFRRGDHRHTVVIGKDTRRSGYMIESALMAGFIASGMDVMLVGPMPTPGVAFLTRSLRADIGVMISASHNPFHDNGIKIFGPDGFKLSDEIEDEITAMINAQDDTGLAKPRELGRGDRLNDARGRYIESLKASFPKGMSLNGLKIVVDCANGAAYHLAPYLFWELGADIEKIGTHPDGFNINDRCGSTHPQRLREGVLEHGADLGIALDGDADRIVLMDEHGKLVDGDYIMAMIAAYWHKQSRLNGHAVVATQMSNLGLERYLNGLGIDLHRTNVGDRYVVEKMRADNLNLGGEQSGHIILSDFATTGDGLLAGLQILAVLCDTQKPLSEFARPYTALPQNIENVRTEQPVDLNLPAIQAAIKAGEERLKNNGRLFVRKSGTEPLVRVMAEADNEQLMNEVIADVAEVIEKAAAAS